MLPSFFALATLIWISDRRVGVFAFVWAAITSSTRIYLGIHYPTDILGGAALGIFIVILFKRLPSGLVVLLRGIISFADRSLARRSAGG